MTALGKAFHAPAARLALLEDLGPGDQPGTVLPAHIQRDVIDTEVTLLNTGVCTWKVTLNNAFTATALERYEAAQDHVTIGADEPEIDGRQGVWPRFKYNDLSRLTPGKRLRIDMRYLGDSGEAGGPAFESSSGWIPMISGPITDVQFAFYGSGASPATVTILGQDDLSRLTDAEERRHAFGRAAELTHVRRVLARAEYPLREIAMRDVTHPDFVTNDSNGVNETIQAGQTFLAFIQKLADRLDYEIFLAFARPDDPASPLEFHFEPWRSRRAPVGSETHVIELGKNLLEFTPSIKVLDQYSRVTVRGRHRDPQLPREVRGEATHAILAGELHAVGGETLRTGPEVRDHFFPGRENRFTIANQSNLDEERASEMARSVIRKKARELFTVEMTTLGLPRLRPGRHVELRGMRKPFDGFFYVTKTVHTLNEQGYRTRITGQRPGLELPAAASAAAAA